VKIIVPATIFFNLTELKKIFEYLSYFFQNSETYLFDWSIIEI